MEESNYIKPSWDPEEFEKSWMECVDIMIKQIMADPTVQKVKDKVRNQGHILPEDRNEFIVIVNEIKNRVIAEKFGEPDSENYLDFVHAWQHWLKLRGKDRPQGENMFEDNVNHLLYGSTPDPNAFLRDFDIYKDIK